MRSGCVVSDLSIRGGNKHDSYDNVYIKRVKKESDKDFVQRVWYSIGMSRRIDVVVDEKEDVYKKLVRWGIINNMSIEVRSSWDKRKELCNKLRLEIIHEIFRRYDSVRWCGAEWESLVLNVMKIEHVGKKVEGLYIHDSIMYTERKIGDLPDYVDSHVLALKDEDYLEYILNLHCINGEVAVCGLNFRIGEGLQMDKRYYVWFKFSDIWLMDDFLVFGHLVPIGRGYVVMVMSFETMSECFVLNSEMMLWLKGIVYDNSDLMVLNSFLLRISFYNFMVKGINRCVCDVALFSANWNSDIVVADYLHQLKMNNKGYLLSTFSKFFLMEGETFLNFCVFDLLDVCFDSRLFIKFPLKGLYFYSNVYDYSAYDCELMTSEVYYVEEAYRWIVRKGYGFMYYKSRGLICREFSAYAYSIDDDFSVDDEIYSVSGHVIRMVLADFLGWLNFKVYLGRIIKNLIDNDVILPVGFISKSKKLEIDLEDKMNMEKVRHGDEKFWHNVREYYLGARVGEFMINKIFNYETREYSSYVEKLRDYVKKSKLLRVSDEVYAFKKQYKLHNKKNHSNSISEGTLDLDFRVMRSNILQYKFDDYTFNELYSLAVNGSWDVGAVKYGRELSMGLKYKIVYEEFGFDFDVFKDIYDCGKVVYIKHRDLDVGYETIRKLFKDRLNNLRFYYNK